jgi:3',5'-cyclic AMP phosphodiesterase CpdA
MVAPRKGNPAGIVVSVALLCALPWFAAACSVDFFGLFASNDFDERIRDRDTFHLLVGEDKELLLPEEEEYSFVVATDIHIEHGDDQGLGRLLDVIDTDGSGTDDKFVVITGDITQNGKREDIECFINFVTELKRQRGIPCYPVLGNHDIYFNAWPVWRDLVGSSCYRVGAPDSGTTLFILDSANASFGSRQLDWLERELGKTKGRVLLFTHANFFIKDLGFADIEQLADVRERTRVISLLAGRADAVFSGHIHKRVERESGGVRYISIEDFRDNKTWSRVYVTKAGLRWEFNKL